MNEIQTFSGISILTGIIMVIFNKPVGIAFCKIGKHVHQSNPIKEMRQLTDKIYDENKGPKNCLMLGIVFIIQGLIFFFAGPYIM